MDIYLIMAIGLFALAISGIVVGVGNDAVNFLNSAVGSKSAPFRVIMIVAAVGVLIGTTFSNGMMEVARNGIMNPQYFHFSEIMLVFVAVMITNVILLDLYNTFGMPTSTTVSLVFGLLGAAVGIGIMKVSNGIGTETILDFINTATALKIIGGILLSVIVAFVSGTVIQYITRFLFSFDFEKKIKYWGAVYGGIAISAITYFILIKGIKDSTYASAILFDEGEIYKGVTLDKALLLKDWIKDNSQIILIASFLGWALLLQTLNWIFKLNILKFIVLTGTFALAMAFAGNDLVNFIGVPLAGFESYKEFVANPGADPNNFLMISMNEPVKSAAYFLVISGLIMVITLWTSKKAHTVIKTELDLTRQDEGNEKFGSSEVSRAIVRSSIKLNENIGKIIPKPILSYINKQFDTSSYNEKQKILGKNAPAFDLMRASINLVVSSSLIAIGTSYKLPLSTTYVTFMVAMGTSLADRSWGRESAVFRITGVLSVILGWFFTAFIAFSTALIVGIFLYLTGIYGVVFMFLLAGFLIYKTHLFHSKATETTSQVSTQQATMEAIGVVQSCNNTIVLSLTDMQRQLNIVIASLATSNRKTLKAANNEIIRINTEAKLLKKSMHLTISKLSKESTESSLYYVQVLDFLREMAHALSFISQPATDHLENGHKEISAEQKADLIEVEGIMSSIINNVIDEISKSDYTEMEKVIVDQRNLILTLKEMQRKQVKRVKEGKSSTKATLLYFSIIHEFHNILLHMINLLKSHRDFMKK